MRCSAAVPRKDTTTYCRGHSREHILFPDWLATMLNFFFLHTDIFLGNKSTNFPLHFSTVFPSPALTHRRKRTSCMHTNTTPDTHTQISKIRQMALSHTLRWLMLLADTGNLCVRVMGVSSFWQTAAQHTFQSNFAKYASPAVAPVGKNSESYWS